MTSGSDCNWITSREECTHAKQELGLTTEWNDSRFGEAHHISQFNNVRGCYFSRHVGGFLGFNTYVGSTVQCGAGYGSDIQRCLCRVWALWLIIKANFPCAPSPSPSKIQFMPSHMRHPSPFSTCTEIFSVFSIFLLFLSHHFLRKKNERRHKPLFSISQLLFVWHAILKLLTLYLPPLAGALSRSLKYDKS